MARPFLHRGKELRRSKGAVRFMGPSCWCVAPDGGNCMCLRRVQRPRARLGRPMTRPGGRARTQESLETPFLLGVRCEWRTRSNRAFGSLQTLKCGRWGAGTGPYLTPRPKGLTRAALFERSRGPFDRPRSTNLAGQCCGNPVQIGDGCATVTGDKLPKGHCAGRRGKAGVRLAARSQETGWPVLVRVPPGAESTSPQKRRMRPVRGRSGPAG